MVLHYNLCRADRKGGKQTDPWDAPYKVAQLCENGLYCLINESIELMRQNKVWETTTEMLAAVDMFHVNVCVWAKLGHTHTWHIHRPKGNVAVNESVYLENNAGNHFNVVIRV